MTIKDTKEIVQFITRNPDNIKRIILFGSTATEGKGNDLDLDSDIVTTPWDGCIDAT